MNSRKIAVAGSVSDTAAKSGDFSPEEISKKYISGTSKRRNGILAGNGLVWAYVRFEHNGQRYKYEAKAKKQIISASWFDKMNYFNGLYLAAIKKLTK